MKRAVVTTLLLLGASISITTGQYFEKNIWLPDSFGRLDEYDVVFHNPVTHRVYAASAYEGGPIQIFDPLTREKFALREPEVSSGYVQRFLHVPRVNRIYAMGRGEGIVAFDDRADTFVNRFGPHYKYPWCEAWHPGVNKLYVCMTGTGDYWVHSFDPTTGDSLGSIRFRSGIGRILPDSSSKRLYCIGGFEDLSIIDCTADTLLVYLNIPDFRIRDAALDQALNRLYCLGENDDDEGVIQVYRASDMLQVDAFPLSPNSYYPNQLFLNPANHLLYVFDQGSYDSIPVIDGRTGQHVGRFDYPPGEVYDLKLDKVSNALYLRTEWYDSIARLGVPDSITEWIEVDELYGFAPIAGTDELLCTQERDTMLVVDHRTGNVRHREPYWHTRVSDMHAVPGKGLFILGNGSISLVGPADTVVKSVPVRYASGCLGYSPEQNNLYVGGEDTLYVYDCELDSVVRRTDLDGYIRRGVLVPSLNRLYIDANSRLASYDTERDSVVASFDGQFRALSANHSTGLVYAQSYDGSYTLVVDAGRDSVVDSLPFMLDAHLANSIDGEIYWPADNGKILVFDATSHEIIDTIVTARATNPVAWFEEYNKLYSSRWRWMYAIDCPTRTVTDSFACINAAEPVVNRNTQHLWLMREEKVIDYASDSAIAEFNSPRIYDLALDTATNRLYLLTQTESDIPYIAVYRDGVPGIGGDPYRESLQQAPIRPTFVRNILPLPGSEPGCLLDITGRRVMDLLPGTHDIRHLSPGVYFLRPEDGRQTTKVIVTE